MYFTGIIFVADQQKVAHDYEVEQRGYTILQFASQIKIWIKDWGTFI